MGDHFFLLMYATSGEERNVTRFTSYRRVEDAVAMVKEWLEKACCMDCYPAAEEVDRVLHNADTLSIQDAEEGELGEQEGVLAADLEAAVVLHGVQGVFQEVLQGLCEPVPVSHPGGPW